ncbi:hypothetical protein [Pelagibacterium sediminicola]|uniref:hypothetical protein n=1 Tax=Pelagibacterium sediminicola TaxID=2248761 RepID=UPI000E31FD58|nr:hypothetical protein [Pelagibacterium sediminicola]
MSTTPDTPNAGADGLKSTDLATTPHFDPMELEIIPGRRVKDLKSREECAVALTQIDMQIEGILAQISKAEADPDSTLNKPGWRSKAQAAIRWKKRTRAAVNRLASHLPHPAGDARKTRAQIVLDTFAQEHGQAEFDRIYELARERHPEAWEGQL